MSVASSLVRLAVTFMFQWVLSIWRSMLILSCCGISYKSSQWTTDLADLVVADCLARGCCSRGRVAPDPSGPTRGYFTSGPENVNEIICGLKYIVRLKPGSRYFFYFSDSCSRLSRRRILANLRWNWWRRRLTFGGLQRSRWWWCWTTPPLVPLHMCCSRKPVHIR